MTKKQDYLPEAERYKPATPQDALLIFGEIGTVKNPLYQQPTLTLPGSGARVEVYAERAKRREPLFHPNDLNDFCGVNLGVRRKSDPILEILKRLES